MKVIGYLPLSAALATIYPFVDMDTIQQDEIEEWASIYMGKLQVRQTYQESVVVLRVQNHKACLPRGTKYIEQMFYKEDPSADDVTLIKLQHQSPDSDTIQTKFLDFASVNSYYANNWSPIRASASIFNQAVHCQNSINLYLKCEAEYSVSKNFIVTTSFEDGYLAVGYLSYPINSEGEFLIPDDEEVLEAIKYGVLSQIWEKRTNFGVENALQMWDRYLELYQIKAAKVVGKLLLPGIDELQNLQDQTTRIGQHRMQYQSAFGNLNTAENIRFDIYGNSGNS